MKEYYTGDIKQVIEQARNENPGKNFIIVHGCNCFNTMGAGLAARLVDLYPEVAIVDSTTERGDVSKLGKYTFAAVNRDLVVINLYTQYRYGRGISHLDYEALDTGLSKLVNRYNNDNVIFIIPEYIGCGLAGGEHHVVQGIIENNFAPDSSRDFNGANLILFSN